MNIISIFHPFILINVGYLECPVFVFLYDTANRREVHIIINGWMPTYVKRASYSLRCIIDLMNDTLCSTRGM